MSELLEKQFVFGQMVPKLLAFINASGKKYVLGYVQRCEECKTGKPMSLHKSKLAIDVYLFTQENDLLNDTIDHLPFGEYWESLGGSWGGRWGDGNHYSLKFGGMR